MPWAGAINVSNVTLTAVGQDLATSYFGSNSSYPIGDCFMPVIKQCFIISNRDIDISLRVDNTATTPFRGTNDNIAVNGYTRINTIFRLKANQRLEINHSFIQLGFTSAITIVNFGYDTGDTTPLNLYVNFLGYSITKNTDLTAPNSILWIGDSISVGTGAGSFEAGTQEPFSQQVKKKILDNGYRMRLINKAQSSMTTSGVVRAIKWGYYNVRQADLICIMIGANDANNLGSGGLSSGTNQTIFQDNIDYIIRYFNKRYPTAKILMIGSTPSADNTTETRIETSRTIMSARVTAYNNNNVKYISCGTAFDRTNTANYLVSDTIHPTQQNAIASVINVAITNFGWYL